MEWFKKLENWKSLSNSEQLEFKKAMEEAYGTQIYNNWYHVRHILFKIPWEKTDMFYNNISFILKMYF